MKEWLYKWLPIIFGCHCRDERSFHYKGRKFPICARCTGELVGIVVSLFSCFFFRLPIWMCILIMIPLIVDGTIQMFTKYESNNLRRVVTGFLFGYGLFMLFAISMIVVTELAIKAGRAWRESLGGV